MRRLSSFGVIGVATFVLLNSVFTAPVAADSPYGNGKIRWFKDGIVTVFQNGQNPYAGTVKTGSTACLTDSRLLIAEGQWADAREVTSQPSTSCASGFGITWPNGGNVSFKDGRQVKVGAGYRACLLPNYVYRIAADQWTILGSIEFTGSGGNASPDATVNSASSSKFEVVVEGTSRYIIDTAMVKKYLNDVGASLPNRIRFVWIASSDPMLKQADGNVAGASFVATEFALQGDPHAERDRVNIYLDKGPSTIPGEDENVIIAHELCRYKIHYVEKNPGFGGYGILGSSDPVSICDQPTAKKYQFVK